MAQHSVPRVIYRYVSGRPLSGAARSDAGYLRRATRVEHGVVLRQWSALPGWRRQAYRLGVPSATLAAGQVYAAHPALTAAGAVPLATYGTVRAGRAARQRWRMRRFDATYIRPTRAALAGALGEAPVQLHVSPELGDLAPRLVKPMSPAEVRVRAWYGEHVEPAVRWPGERAMRGAWVLQRWARPATSWAATNLRRPRPADAGPRIELTAGVPYLTAEQRQYVESVIAAKIPVSDMNKGWDMVGDRVRCVWTVKKRPPTGVGYADLDARIGSLQEYEFFVGLGVGGKPVVISLKDDSPHIACSAGSGAGKSVLAKALAVQGLARGGRVVILDRKGSHRWALGLPGVDYCTAAEQMHQAILRLAKLADQRNADALHMPEDWDPGQRVFVIAEELNATFQQLKDYWEDTRERGAAKTSPAVKGFRNLLFMGRSAKINVFAVAQMLTANTTGGPESRENFGIRCLARYTVNAWKMLVPEAGMPRVSRTLGRWQIVTGGVATETQVVYLTDHEARLLIAKMSPTGLRPGDNSWSEPFKGDRAAGDTPVPTDPLSERLTLRDAVDRGLAPWKYDAAKKRLQRARKAGDAAAPEPVGKEGNADLYRIGDLIVWIETELGVGAEADQ